MPRTTLILFLHNPRKLRKTEQAQEHACYIITSCCTICSAIYMKHSQGRHVILLHLLHNLCRNIYGTRTRTCMLYYYILLHNLFCDVIIYNTTCVSHIFVCRFVCDVIIYGMFVWHFRFEDVFLIMLLFQWSLSMDAKRLIRYMDVPLSRCHVRLPYISRIILENNEKRNRHMNMPVILLHPAAQSVLQHI